jgi:N-acetylmuramoyl-L-alanine amidase
VAWQVLRYSTTSRLSNGSSAVQTCDFSRSEEDRVNTTSLLEFQWHDLQIARGMKLPLQSLLVVLLTVFTVTTPLQAASRRAEAPRFPGKDYIRVQDWAKSNDLDVRWVKKEETLKISSKSGVINLSVDSSAARFNGVEIKLLYPIAARDGVPYISQLDTQNTFRPLLSPPQNRAGQSIRSIVIDPGHGGPQPGYIVGGQAEKKYTLLLAQELQEQLKRAGFKVSLTRTGDREVSWPERPDIAKRRGADLFISLHFNAAPSSAATVRGAEVYALTPAGAPSSNSRGEGADSGWFAGNRFNDKNMLLAYEMQKSLVSDLGVEDRGVHRARFWVLRDATMPAILIEGGFMSHPVEGKKIFDPAYRKKMAQSITNGILNYKRHVDAK